MFFTQPFIFSCTQSIIEESHEPIKKNSTSIRVVEPFEKGYATVMNNNKYGLIDRRGKYIIPCDYDNIHTIDYQTFKIKLNNKYGVIDKNEKTIIPCIYDFIYLNRHLNLFEVRLNKKKGYLDLNGSEIIPIKYSIDDSGNKNGFVRLSINNKYGYLDINGKVLIPFEYSYISLFKEGSASAEKDGKWGFIDTVGNIITPFKFKNAHNFSEGLALVIQNEKTGFINKKSELTIPSIYDWAYDFEDNIAIVQSGNHMLKLSSMLTLENNDIQNLDIISLKYGVINKKGELLIELIYDEIKLDTNGVLFVLRNNKWGAIDTTGTVLVDFIYDHIQMYSAYKNEIIVEKDNSFGVIDNNGNILIPIRYDSISFSCNREYFTVIQDDLVSYFDTSYTQITEFKYELIHNDCEYNDLITVECNGKYGFINKKGAEIVKCQFDYLKLGGEPFNLGIKNGKEYLINRKGEIFSFWQDK